MKLVEFLQNERVLDKVKAVFKIKQIREDRFSLHFKGTPFSKLIEDAELQGSISTTVGEMSSYCEGFIHALWLVKYLPISNEEIDKFLTQSFER